MFYRLPPVGSPIRLGGLEAAPDYLSSFFHPYTIKLYHSGTMALAAAIVAAVQTIRRNSPEVIIPAYSCPDLVSAVLYADATPVLVDMEAGKPWLDLDQLRNKVTANTVAVVAVHLFGIPERIRALREIAESAGALLIEDSAQALPLMHQHQGHGDFVVLSFGRGKPVTLLRGGAVLCRDERLVRILQKSLSYSAETDSGYLTKFRLEARLYNALISPYIYWAIHPMPLLHLGETRYLPLKKLMQLDRNLIPYLATNIADYLNQNNPVQRWITDMLANLKTTTVADLATACCGRNLPRLLRYPLRAATNELRESLIRRLNRVGLGPSRMYPAPLTEISGLNEILGQQQGLFPHAKDFADRILTLPTHPRVRLQDVEKIATIIRADVNQSASA